MKLQNIFTQSFSTSALELLQKVDDSVPAKDILDFKNCILFHSSLVNLTVEPFLSKGVTLSSPSTSGSDCTGKSAKLLLTYSPGHGVDKLFITFLFKNRGAYWQTYTTLKMTYSKKTSRLPITYTNVTSIGAAFGRSYFCTGLRIKSVLPDVIVNVYFSRLKIQPFGVMGKSFGNSDICSYSLNLMTPAIWEGVLVSLVFISVIMWGVLYLVEVPSRERFGDPKDKTISTSIVTPK